MALRLVVGLATLVGCAAEHTEAVAPPEPLPTASEPTAAPTHAELVAAVARDYESWRLVDDEFHWAPGLCRLPVRGGEHLSHAEGAAHDGKLFVLRALDINAYGVAAGWTGSADHPLDHVPSRAGLSNDVVQALVKESYVAVEWKDRNTVPSPGFHSAVRDGKVYRPGDPIGLFVMIQFATAREGTDDGWIYGTVAPDGKVTSASDVGACRDCHAARENRLFGLPRPPAFGM